MGRDVDPSRGAIVPWPESEVPVSAAIERGHPEPAFVRLLDLLPEALLDRAFSHAAPVHIAVAQNAVAMHRAPTGVLRSHLGTIRNFTNLHAANIAAESQVYFGGG